MHKLSKVKTKLCDGDWFPSQGMCEFSTKKFIYFLGENHLHVLDRISLEFVGGTDC